MTGSKYFCCWPLLWWTDRRKVNTQYTLPPCIQFVNLDQQSVGATLEPATILGQEIWAPKNWFKIRHWQQTSPQTTSAEKRYPSGQSLEIMERGGKKMFKLGPSSAFIPAPPPHAHPCHGTDGVSCNHFQIQCCIPTQAMSWFAYILYIQ